MSFLKNKRQMFLASDDSAIMEQIQATHAPDGRKFAVGPLLHIVKDIFQRAAPVLTGLVEHNQDLLMDAVHQAQWGESEDKALQNGFSETLELLSHTIAKIACEISCKCSGGGDTHATTLSIFNQLSSFSWDAKVVLALAAFAVNYGEFWLVAQLYLTNPLAKAVARLKQLPEILERANTVKTQFDAFNNLIKTTMDVAKCIVDFKELPSQHITPDMPDMVAATAQIPTAVYWTIRSIVACASQMMGLNGMGYEYTTTEGWELSSFAHKVSNIHSHLTKHLHLCNLRIEERRYEETYRTLIRLFEGTHIDNRKILRAVIYTKDDQLPLYDGSTHQRASLDVLRRKNVLLFISDLDLSDEEVSILQIMYSNARRHTERMESQFEVVWLPIVDRSTPWSQLKQESFEILQLKMPWHSLFHPSVLDPAVVRYIKEVWHFNKKPLIVVLDPQGKVVNNNAIPMIWIWGSLAYPFNNAKEESLWKNESWRIKLLVDTIDLPLFTGIQEGRHICLYGGEDLEWIRKFTTTARSVAEAVGIQLDMLYVGKSNPRDKVKRNNEIIKQEGLSHVMQDKKLVWFFWARLECMWQSKIKLNKTTENDPIMQEIMTMLSFDGSDQGWAVIGKGSEMAKAKGETMLTSLNGFEEWKDHVTTKGFVRALNDQLHELPMPHHCNRLILPGITGNIHERLVCAECGRNMERFIMYRCCTD